VKEKAELCTDFAPSCLTYFPSVRVSTSLSKLSFRSLFRHQLLPFNGGTWVTRAGKDGGTIESVLNSHFFEDCFCFS
jgi:hypothetical protein